jgi:hypothetical protein
MQTPFIHDRSVSVSWLFTLRFEQKSNEVIKRFSYGDSVITTGYNYNVKLRNLAGII